jgi:hypothetical protein
MILCQATLLTNSLLWATLLHAGWNTLTAVVTMPSGTQRVALAVAVAVVMLSLTGWGLRSRQRAEN